MIIKKKRRSGWSGRKHHYHNHLLVVNESLQGVKSLSGGRVEFGGAEQLQEMRTKASSGESLHQKS